VKEKLGLHTKENRNNNPWEKYYKTTWSLLKKPSKRGTIRFLTITRKKYEATMFLTKSGI